MTKTTAKNEFKTKLQTGTKQLGVWLAMGDSISAEICAGAGYDFAVIDAEHGATHSLTLYSQLQAIAGYQTCDELVRVPSSDPVVLRQIIDAGARSILVPMVNTPEQAASIVKACRFPLQGERGIGSSRAARWGRYSDYYQRANAELCIMVQIETVLAMDNLEAITNVEGVDGVFIGAADLAASMGYIGRTADPVVQTAVTDCVRRITALGKPAGSLIMDTAFAIELMNEGASFIAVTIDSRLLMTSLEKVLVRTKALMSKRLRKQSTSKDSL